MITHLIIRVLSILSLIGIISTHTSSTHALSMTPYSLDELWSESQLIVRGEIVKTSSYRDQGRIFTTFTLIPTSPLFKGELTGQRIHFSLPGGQLDGLAQRVPGIPMIHTGEELILFLRCRSPNTCSPVGYGQGIWRPVAHTWRPITQEIHWIGARSPLMSQSLEQLTAPR